VLCNVTLWYQIKHYAYNCADTVAQLYHNAVASGVLKEPCIGWGSDRPCKEAIFSGKDMPGMPEDILR